MAGLPFLPPEQTAVLPSKPRFLLQCVLFLLGLFAACGLLRSALERAPDVLTEDHWRSQQLVASFLDQKDDLDLVFVGSSRFMRGIDPGTFDAMTEVAGFGTRSFNYAMNGMRMLEIMARVDWILEQDPAQLKFLLVEITSLDPLYRGENRLGRRMIEWHDARAAEQALRVIVGSNRSLANQFLDAGPHLAEYGLHVTNVGLGGRLLRHLTGSLRLPDTPAGFRGFARAAEVEAREQKLERTTREEKKAKRKRKKALVQAAGDLRDELPPAQEALLREFVLRVQAHGVQLAFVTMPAPRFENTPGFYFDRTGDFARSKGVLPVSFTYYDRARFKSLYAPENFIDDGHLSDAGAKLFSRRLALDFAGEFAMRRSGN